MQLSEVFHVSQWHLSALAVSEAVDGEPPPFPRTDEQKAAPGGSGGQQGLFARELPFDHLHAARQPRPLQAADGCRGGGLPAVGAAAAESARGFPADVSLSKMRDERWRRRGDEKRHRRNY